MQCKKYYKLKNLKDFNMMMAIRSNPKLFSKKYQL